MALTKEQILYELSLLDIDKLETLHNYSEQLIIPEEDLLTNATMSQMMDKAFELANTFFPEWTDRGKSDFGAFLLELFALFSEKDFWYINAFANETVFQKIAVYSDAFTRAICLGYEPILCRGAAATFDVSFAPGSQITYKRGALILILQDKNGNKFTNDEEFTVPLSAAPVTLPLILREGVQSIQNVVFNGHSISIDRELVDIESIQVVIDGVIWNRVRSWGRSSNNSPHYIVVPEENGSFTIYFGDNLYGKKPEFQKNIKVYYRTTLGAASNSTISTQVNVNASNSLRPALVATMTTAATGGEMPESLSSIKAKAIFYFSSKQAAINAIVMEELLNAYPEVKKSKVTALGAIAYFRIIPENGTVAGATLLTTIEQRITELLMLGYSATGLPTVYINVSPIKLDVFTLPGYASEQTKSLVRQLVQDYTNPLVLAEYGMDFNLTDLNLLIRARVPGVQNVVFTTVAGVAAANVTVQETEIMNKVDFNNITITVSAI